MTTQNELAERESRIQGYVMPGQVEQLERAGVMQTLMLIGGEAPMHMLRMRRLQVGVRTSAYAQVRIEFVIPLRDEGKTMAHMQFYRADSGELEEAFGQEGALAIYGVIEQGRQSFANAVEADART